MTKNTKKAVWASALSILMCLSLLIGTTFAWFTDTASTSVNKIQAGTLDIGLEMKTGVDDQGNSTWENAEGKTLAWKKAAGHENDEVLWEPGCTYELPTLKITNKGNLGLQFKILINNITGDLELLNALNFSFKYSMLEEYLSPVEVDTGAFEGTSLNNLPFEIPCDPSGLDPQNQYNLSGYILEPGEIGDNFTNVGYYTIKAHMKKEAGNEYQNKKLENISITVVATQVAGFESDSFGDIYDKDAEYPVVVSDEAALKEALAAGKNVRLGSDIALTSAITFSGDVEIIGDGKSVISANPVYVASTANVNFKNVNFATPDNSNNNASSVYASGLEGKVVFDGCTFTNPQWECIQITPKDGAEVIVTNCTFIVDGHGTYAQANGTKVERMLHIQNTAASGKYTAVITNNKFIGVDLCRNAVIDVDDIEAFENVTCGGNTFFNHDETPVSTLADGMIYVNINRLYDAANVATNTFAQFTQTPAAKLHH